MNKVALLLSGLGYEKGTSVFEIPFILRSLEKRGMMPQPVVPSESFQAHGYIGKDLSIQKSLEVMFEERIFTIPELSPKDIDGVIVLGGKGNTSVLTDFHTVRGQCKSTASGYRVYQGRESQKKTYRTIWSRCCSCCFLTKKVAKPILTCGGDSLIQDVLERMESVVVNTTAENVVIDEEN
jgi:enhancing lycopene biosynthesis protein 2